MLGTEDQSEKPGSSSAPDTADVEQEESGPPVDVDAEALELMGQGKRNLVVGDPPAAVQCFQEACELLASKYGETAEECGDAYYQYGCSLLELASMENGVLGNALQGVPDDSADSADSDEEGAEKPSGSTVESADKLEEKEREEVIQQVKDALEANCESEESEKEDKGKEGTEEEEEDKEEKMEEDGDNKEKEAAAEDGKKDKEKKKDETKEVEGKNVEEKEKELGEEKKDAEKKVEEKDEKKEEKKDEEKSEKEVQKKATDTEKAGDADKKEKKEKKDDDDDDEAGPSAEDDQKEDADDVSNFQLAWEMLELARVIISKKEGEESQMKASQIHLKLGELGLETEQYTQSIVDFKTCLEIQKKYLDPESRLIAGTHYNLGLACSFAQLFDESIEHYRESKQLIEKRLASLEKKVSETEGKGKEKADENDPIVCAQKEIDELKELLPDVVSKLEDAKDMKQQAATSSAGAGPSSSTSSGFASSSSAFAPSSSTEPAQQIAVKKAGDSVPVTDISHLVRKKRKPEETDAAADSKRSRQEENGEKPAVNGSGDTKVANGSMANGVMNGDMNGDSKHSPEKPAEIKTKKLAQEEEAPAAMETS